MKRIFTTLSQKWPEYLLEILVITIGILGAFALNNWNENRKEEIEAQNLYNQLLLDYEVDLEQLNQKIEMHQTITNAGFAILSIINDPDSIPYDSLVENISIFGNDPTFDPIKNEILNTRKIDLIKNQELNRLISNWSSDLVALREVELTWQDLASGSYLTVISKIGVGRDAMNKAWSNSDNEWLLSNERQEFKSISKAKIHPTINEIIKNKEFEGIVSYGIILNQTAIKQGMGLKSRIERIIELLKKERK